MRPYVSVSADENVSEGVRARPRGNGDGGVQSAASKEKRAPHGIHDLATTEEDGATSNTYGIPNTLIQPQRTTATIPSSDNPQSRRDPFQFGTRYLAADSSIFSHNAWDHVDPTTDSSYQTFASQMLALQRTSPARDPALLSRTLDNPAAAWNTFYNNHESRFFKDRKWLFQEFPQLAHVTAEGAGSVRVVEVGAGAGNTVLPLVRQNRNAELQVHALDFSSEAVRVMRGTEEFGAGAITGRVSADEWDLAGEELPPCFRDSSAGADPSRPTVHADIIILIFTFSALSPTQWPAALRNMHRLLRPGGVILFRDYARGDLAQIRFREGRWLEEGFYVRGDGTRVYFLGEGECARVFADGGRGVGGAEGSTPDGLERSSVSTGHDHVGTDVDTQADMHNGTDVRKNPLFATVKLATDRRMLVNRKRKLKMYRCWLQGVFEKPVLGGDGSEGG